MKANSMSNAQTPEVEDMLQKDTQSVITFLSDRNSSIYGKYI